LRTANQLLFVNTEKGTFNMDVRTMKDVQWHTQTCTMGWPVQVSTTPCLPAHPLRQRPVNPA
jgi:hypothetical protein